MIANGGNEFEMDVLKSGKALFKAFVIPAMLVAAGATAPVYAAPDVDGAATPDIVMPTSGHLHDISGPDAILSVEDQLLYREIFALQENGQWQQADKAIARLGNDILMGHVQFQRYMHPTAYRSRFSELSGWMGNYADLPGAWRIYALAKRRQGRAGNPRRPVPIVAPRPQTSREDAIAMSAPGPRARPLHTSAENREIARVSGRMQRQMRRGQAERAEKRLWAFERRDILGDVEFDQLLTQVASSYFYSGDDEKALALAAMAAARSRHEQSQADWIAGLAAWRLGRCATAARHFGEVATSIHAGAWIQAGGAYWAGRSHLVCDEPAEVENWLNVAASFRGTFYGLLATRQLGLKSDYDWYHPELSDDDFSGLTALPAVRRAIALFEVGQDALADYELRYVWSRGQYANREAVIALGARLGLPATQILLAQGAPGNNALPDSVFYPVPDWEPEGGYKIDRAVFIAIMRQESHFMPRARSGVGAMGLMQLMPATASWVARDSSLRWSNKSRLFEPELNMSISQTYMLQLMEDNVDNANMFEFATAYNGGPGNLNRWQREMNFQDDPLLFVETIPARETRNFIERVFANLWIYRDRLGQPTPSLDALAAGDWPRYRSIDGDFPPRLSLTPEEARHAEN
jgi:peptidoglycan lytic transglycosylase